MKPSMILDYASTEELDAAARAAIIGVCVLAHQANAFKDLFSWVPSGGRHFLAYRENELVSHAMVTTRWLQPEGLPLLKTAYVDAVSTLPDYQNQGYGSAVMQHLAQNIADYSIACLESDRPTFYTRLGWEVWRGALAGRGKDGLIPTPDQQGVMILRLPHTPVLDLDGGLSIEAYDDRIW